jgi:predicted ATPase
MRYTNWYVITGAPSSGKTSVICDLEKLGYRVVHEVARAYLDEQLQKGKRLKQIKADSLSFESQFAFFRKPHSL